MSEWVKDIRAKRDWREASRQQMAGRPRRTKETDEELPRSKHPQPMSTTMHTGAGSPSKLSHAAAAKIRARVE